MDKTIDWGGNAFPELGNTGYNSDWQLENGMFLRDYFAAKALPYALGGCWPDMDFVPTNGLSISENCAILAYQIADAMIKARNGS